MRPARRRVVVGVACLLGAAALPATAAADGLFAPPVRLAGESSELVAAHVQPVDVDGDGDQDLVSYGAQETSAELDLNDGAGGFTPAGSIPIGRVATALGAGDVNGDGRADLVFSTATGLRLLLGTGGGAFAAPKLVIGGNFADVAVADVTADGLADVVAIAGPNITVLKGTATGALASLTRITGAAGPAVRVADVNGDKRPDVVTFGPDGIKVIGDVGRAVHPLLWSSPAPFSPARDLAIGDVTGDGRPDLITVAGGSTQYCDFDGCEIDPDPAHAPSRIVFAGTGTGTFTRVASDTHFVAGEAVATGDFDADGKGDMAATFGEFQFDYVDNLAETFTGESERYDAQKDNGAANPGRLFGTSDWITDLIADDLNGDGRDDLVGVNGYGGLEVLLATPPAGTTAELPARSPDNTSTAVLGTLATGQRYTVTVAGTYSPYAAGLFTSPYHRACGTTDLVRNRTSDAEVDFGSFTTGTCPTTPPRANHRLSFDLGAGAYDPAPVSSEYTTYTYSVVGKGAPLTVRLKDSNGRDNSGALRVSVTPG